jgi:hypothetical protein
MLVRAVNPSTSLLEGLREWNAMAHRLREPPRKKRRYQGDELDRFVS